MSLSPHLLTVARGELVKSRACVVVSVVEVKGSAPRGVGTSMLVLPDSITDTIGGGRLEYEAIRLARDILSNTIADADVNSTNASMPVVRKRYPLGDSLGQCCGGAVTLVFDRLDVTSVVWIDEALDCLQRRKRFERQVTAGVRYVAQPPHANLLLFGAGHVGRALVSVLADAPISIHWVDERASEFPQRIPVNVHIEVSDLPDVILKNAPPQSAVVVTTHRHDLDFSLVETALQHDALAYVGMIGSQSKRKRFERQWVSRGRADHALQNLVCPIGHQGPSGKEPAVVAIAVAYEILKVFGE